MSRRSSRGQALAEFALIAPIFFLLLFSIIQLGLLMGAQNGLVNAVRDTARRAATYRLNAASFDGSNTFNGICSVLRTELTGRLRKEIPGYSVANLVPAPVINYHWKSNNEVNTATTYFLVAEVTVHYRHPLYVPLVSGFIDGTDGANDGVLTLEAGEQMRVENPDIQLIGGVPADQACPWP